MAVVTAKMPTRPAATAPTLRMRREEAVGLLVLAAGWRMAGWITSVLVMGSLLVLVGERRSSAPFCTGSEPTRGSRHRPADYFAAAGSADSSRLAARNSR